MSHLRFAQDNRHVRVDTGVRQGDSVSMHYDPMIAKVIVWDHDRKSCLRRMQSALNETQVVGVTTNIDFLSSLVSHPAFQAAELDTGFIERHHGQLFLDNEEVNDNILALAALYILLHRSKVAKEDAIKSSDPTSPWHSTNAWQSNIESSEEIHLGDNEKEYRVQAHYRKESIFLEVNNHEIAVSGSLTEHGDLNANLGGTRTHVTVVRRDDILTILHSGNNYELNIINKTDQRVDEDAVAGSLLSPMPGKVIEVLVKKGDFVKKGSALLILEAMKMEHTISAPLDGIVTILHYAAGDMLDEGVELLVVDEE